jgi:hypothetical protein
MSSTTTTTNNEALIAYILTHTTRIHSSSSLSHTEKCILVVTDSRNYLVWNNIQADAGNLIAIRPIRHLAPFTDIDSKWINWVEGGTLVLVSREGYEHFVRTRRRRGLPGLA